jgi:hypothetical protein
MATIVLGYDASPGAERALETALEITTHFGDRLLIASERPHPARRPTKQRSTGTRSRSWARGSRRVRSDAHATPGWRARWSWCRSDRRRR